jgi:hypothetical protein
MSERSERNNREVLDHDEMSAGRQISAYTPWGYTQLKLLIRSGLLVDLIGIEPMTSSMPLNVSNRKI